MIQILQPPPRKPKFMDQLLSGVQQAGQQLPGVLGGMAENQALQRIGGEDVSGLSPDLKNTYLSKLLGKKEEKRNLNDTFGGILDQMEGLIDNVGPALANPSSWNPYSEKSGKRSQINTLRLSLEGLFRDLTLKGQFPKAIYERILKELPSASDTPEQYKNKIQAIRDILQSHTGGGGAGGSSMMGNKPKPRFNEKHPEHKKKAEQLFKTYKDVEKVREALGREFEGVR